jgi:hypothetical protein
MHTNNETTKTRNNNNSASAKIVKVLENIFFPMLESHQIKNATTFDPIDIHDSSLMEHLSVEVPEVMKCKSVFLEFMSKLYDEWCETTTG